MKVFFTDPETIKRIPPEVSLRIVKVMTLNAEILIGNLSEFDEIALGILFLLEYPRVTIYQTGDKDNMGYPIVTVGQHPAVQSASSLDKATVFR
jgi:hypothetical protein